METIWENAPFGLNNLRGPQIRHVAISTQPDVIRQVIAGMVGIVIEDNVIRVPEPIPTISKVCRRNAEERTAKPETVRSATFQPVDAAWTNFCRKAAMLPDVINAITGVVAAGLMPDPPVVFCMNVRRFRMAVFIAEASSLFRYRSLPELCGRVNTRCRLWSSRWSRPPGRNVSPAHVAATTLFVLLWLSSL